MATPNIPLWEVFIRSRNGLAHKHAEKVAVFIKNTVGITARIRVVAPDTLERSLGKAKRVYDKRPKG